MKWGLRSRIEIENMLKMVHRNDISVDVLNEPPIREYGTEKIYQNSKYKIMKNGAYYVHHD